MKVYGLVFAFLAVTALGDSQGVNPIQKVVELLSNLEAKLLNDGEVEAKAYKEYFEWCDDTSKELGFEIKTATAKKGKLEATIEKASSDIDVANQAISDIAGSVATDEADLKAATEIRAKENADFAAVDAELASAVDMLARAIGILEREMSKTASLAQMKVDTSNMASLLGALNTVIEAASFSNQDKSQLVALVQSRSGTATDEDDGELGAPAPDAYKSKSGSIVDILEDMKEKAEAELSEARKAEMNSEHNFNMLKQSITDAIKASNHELEENKAALNEATETKATAEGDLEITNKALAEGQSRLEDVHDDCMEKASDHEITVQGRKDELEALAQAKKILQDMTAGAEAQTYLQLSSKMQTGADLANVEVVTLIKNLAKKHGSTALAQLASRLNAVIRYGGQNQEDVFAKVKGLINDMIAKLLKEAEDEAGEKAYCDEEMSKTKAKKDELSSTIESLNAKIDQATTTSTRLKGEVKVLQEELLALAKMQAEMDQIRADTNAAFLLAKADLTQGLDGVRKALKVLRDFYQAAEEGDDAAFMQQPAAPEKHAKSTGAGGGIISMLEVIESDFAKNLAEEESEESAAATEYEKVTQENKIAKATKEQDVKYKTKEHKSLDNTVAELSGDRDGAQTELDAVLEYYDKIKERCIAKPETYEERKRRREAEIKGLKEALTILEGEANFLQRRSRSIRMH